MDEEYMKLALELAKKGKGKVNPNPLVGAIIVKDGRIIGKGYHKKYGENHAEVNAFEDAKEDTTGATIYVTLEPCSHYGKTPPCVNKIIEKKISKVVIGMLDPNPLVSGRSIKKLKESGVEVVVGVLEDQCKKLNEIFLKFITKREPFVLMKSAMSLDGKIATSKGESRWITSQESRKKVHELRRDYSAIMVGINTVIIDDPELTCRLVEGKNPIRVIVDSSLKISVSSKIVDTAKEVKTIIATTKRADKDKIKLLENKGIKVIVINEKNNKVDLKELMMELARENIDSVLLEGGATLNFSALEAGIVDKVQIYVAPIIIGGKEAKTIVEGQGIDKLKDSYKIINLKTIKVGKDILIEGDVKSVYRHN